MNNTRNIEEQSDKIKTFVDMITPSIIKFNVDHFICGNTFRCVWALREYPTSTNEQAILRHLGEKDGVTLRIYTRHVTPIEEKRIIHNAANKNRMHSTNTNDLQQTVTAESNLQDVITLVSTMHRNREPLLHCAVYIELTASDMDGLKLLQTDVLTELVRSKLNVDRLILRQQQGFLCVGPIGKNVFGSQFERVLPASSVANLYPFNYSGKTDSHGFYLGRDKYGSNIIVDFDKREDDKTNPCILILGNSGQGKSYLLKLILCNILESGKNVICLDPEHEYVELAENLGGCFVDLMSGEYMINPLEPKTWDEGGSPQDKDAPVTFRQATKLSQHISFLKDFFRCYKDFGDKHIDVIEIMLGKLYSRWKINDSTDFGKLGATDYPILSDLYNLIDEEYRTFDKGRFQLFTAELLQEILLGLHSMCQGAESKFFCGHTNITSNRFVVFAGFIEVESQKPWKYAEYRIGKMFAAGLGTEKDYQKAGEWFTLSAEKKYKYAQYSLGALYYRGKGVEQDFHTAFELYLKSANQGFPYANFEVAKMYRDGVGVEKDEFKAKEHFKRAFHGFELLDRTRHDDKIQYRLGWMLQNGIGIEMDIQRAKNYYEMSVKLGNVFSGYALGKLIINEKSPDPEELQRSIRFLSAVAENNDVKYEAIRSSAAYLIGKLFLEGRVVMNDIDKAIVYLTNSAEQGNSVAQYLLGKTYLLGMDVVMDKELATKWLTRSTEQGNEYAKYFLDNMDKFKEPTVVCCISRLIDHMSRIFEENMVSHMNPGDMKVDSKLLRKLKEKKVTQGHKSDERRIEI